MFDYIIVGAGFSGSVIAERIASILNKKVLVIEKRNHIGGNCYDYRDDNNIIIHKYGPHLFHTDYKDVVEYLSNFTEWHLYYHKVLGYIDGKKIPLPFNFKSIDMVFDGKSAEIIKEKLVRIYGFDVKVPILELKQSNDNDLKLLADFIYEKVFRNYTAKQWGKKPEEIDSSVTARVPVYTSYREGYFTDKYQMVPEKGYTYLFKNMLNNQNIKIMLNTDFKELIKVDLSSGKVFFMGQEFKGKLVFTGMIDELFDYVFGILPYRSLQFKLKIYEKDFFQETAVVNYPNNYDFTRITEFKHIHPADTNKTTIMIEYPKDYNLGETPYYPVFTDEAQECYNKYKELASKFENLILVGRLAEYKYYDMDDVVKRALEVFEEELK